MNKASQTSIIIGASLDGLIAAKTIAKQFKKLIIIEKQAADDLSDQEQVLVHELRQISNVAFMFNTSVRGYLDNEDGKIVSVYYQAFNQGLRARQADIIIDASGNKSYTAFWLQSLGYEAVEFSDKQMMISEPIAHMVNIQAHHYHKMSALPVGLYIIGKGISNIADLTGQREGVARIQAHLLKQYLASEKTNIRFQKNIVNILSMIKSEYVETTNKRLGLKPQLDIRGFAGARR